MKEKELESRLVHMVSEQGGLALKFISPGMAGVPDRLVLMPGGKAVFCELKAPGKAPRPLQLRRMEQLRALGFRVYVVDSVEKIGELMTDVILNGAAGGAEGSPPEDRIPQERRNR